MFIYDQMAQLLVHIDPDLKRNLKAKLAREGKTLKSWVTQMAQAYLGEPVIERGPSSVPRPDVTRREPPVVHPQTGPIQSTYNLEED